MVLAKVRSILVVESVHAENTEAFNVNFTLRHLAMYMYL